MDLVSLLIKTKGIYNFVRRLWEQAEWETD